MANYYLEIKDKNGKYQPYEVSEEVFRYVDQLETYILNPEESKLKEFYSDRFGVDYPEFHHYSPEEGECVSAKHFKILLERSFKE